MPALASLLGPGSTPLSARAPCKRPPGRSSLQFRSPTLAKPKEDAIVLEGTLKEKGMIAFKDILTQDDVNAVNAYLVARANEDFQDHIAQ